jgi:hypothetical protein
MDDAQECARLHVATDRELAAIRRAEQRMAAEERGLERRLDDLEADIERAEQTIDVYLRAENCGHEPDRPPFWRADGPIRHGGRSGLRESRSSSAKSQLPGGSRGDE